MLKRLIRHWRSLFAAHGEAPDTGARAEAELAARADFARACLQRARALRALGNDRAALADFERATGLVPDDAQAWAEQAEAHLALNAREEALDCCELALAHAPDCTAARRVMSCLLREAGDAAAALVHIQHALTVAPDEAALHFESALVHSRRGDVPAVLAAYERTIALDPGHVGAWSNLGLMYLSHLGDPPRAQQYFERAIELDPSSVAAKANLGLALDEQGLTDAALAHYERLIAAHPGENEYRWNRGLARLRSGDYAGGWDDYEMRNARPAGIAPRVFPYPVWNGMQPRAGAALLVYAEQGLGDEIMFASCVPDLLARGIACVIECDPRLAALFARSFPGVRVHGAARDGDRKWLAAYPGIEAQIAIGSLPRLLRRTVTDFPRHAGYLQADLLRVAHWRARLGNGPNVGIAWRGGTAKTGRNLRTVPLRELAFMLALPGVNYINLQRDAGDELTRFNAESGVNLGGHAQALDDFEEFAALVQALDVIVTVDNTVAHLAGALGRKTMVMLPYHADWRWLRAAPASPWYPSVILFRQTVPGDWADSITRVRTALASSS